MYSFTGHGAISQKPNDVYTKHSVWSLKTVDLEYQVWFSVAWMVIFLVQKFAKFGHPCIAKRRLTQDNLFFMAVYMHKVPLYLNVLHLL